MRRLRRTAFEPQISNVQFDTTIRDGALLALIAARQRSGNPDETVADTTSTDEYVQDHGDDYFESVDAVFEDKCIASAWLLEKSCSCTGAAATIFPSRQIAEDIPGRHVGTVIWHVKFPCSHHLPAASCSRAISKGTQRVQLPSASRAIDRSIQSSERATKRNRPFASFCRRLRFEPLEHRRLLATITVDTLTDGIGVPGTSLREAIAAASANDTINFSATGTINLTNLGELVVNKNLTINGPAANLLTINAFDPTPATNNGDGSRVMAVSDIAASLLNVSISGLTLTGGDSPDAGGGIANAENLALHGLRHYGQLVGRQRRRHRQRLWRPNDRRIDDQRQFGR